MRRIWATVPGAEVRVSHYGTATNDQPCLVPDSVAEELAHVEGLKVEPAEPAPAQRKKQAAEPAKSEKE